MCCVRTLGIESRSIALFGNLQVVVSVSDVGTNPKIVVDL